MVRRLAIPSMLMAALAFSLFSFRDALAADAFTLSSTTFKDGGLMPKRASNNTAGNANCIGENTSPQLSWSGAPDGVKSFALTMVDPEGRKGLGVYHWIA